MKENIYISLWLGHTRIMQKNMGMCQTLQGFLKKYLVSLTGKNTTSLMVLSAAVEQDSPRAQEALFCFAAASGQLPYFLKINSKRSNYSTYAIWADELSRYENLEDYLTAESTDKRLKDVYKAFKGQEDVLNAHRRMNKILIGRINDAISSQGLTKYSVAKNAKVNLGNFYAFLAGDPTRLSYVVAQDIYDYLTSNTALKNSSVLTQ